MQDTIKSPGETQKMKRAAKWGIATTTFFYACIGIIGYSAFGNAAPGNLLSGCVPKPTVPLASIPYVHLKGDL